MDIQKMFDKLGINMRCLHTNTSFLNAGGWFFNLGLAYVINIDPKSMSDRQVVMHEVGHAFFQYYFGTDILPEDEFKVLFGPPQSMLAFLSTEYKMYRKAKGYVSGYARNSPEEDFCEVFSVAHEPLTKWDSKTRKKIRFVRKCIREAKRSA